MVGVEAQAVRRQLGVFLWATPDSIKRLEEGKGRLPAGIEVQVLDLGYAELYEKRHKKPSDWFTHTAMFSQPKTRR